MAIRKIEVWEKSKKSILVLQKGIVSLVDDKTQKEKDLFRGLGLLSIVLLSCFKGVEKRKKLEPEVFYSFDNVYQGKYKSIEFGVWIEKGNEKEILFKIILKYPSSSDRDENVFIFQEVKDALSLAISYGSK